MQALYEGEDAPTSIAVDDRYLYWSTRDALRRAPLSGQGAPVTLATGSYIRRLVLEGEYIYFAQSSETSGSIQRVRRTGGEPERIAVAGNPWGMAISDGVLYWADAGNSEQSGVMMRAALDGLLVTPVATGLFSPGDIAVGEAFIYFWSTSESCFAEPGGGSGCIGGGIWQLPKGGGSAERIHATSASGAIILHRDVLYWPTTSPPRVMSAPLGGGERQVVDVLADGIGDLTSDGGALYWASQDRVLRMPFDAGGVVRLASELEGASAVAVRGGWAYVAERTSGRILRVAIDGSANRPTGPIAGPCPTPIGSADDLALTPRADANLELFALSLEPGRVTVSSSVYERVVADVGALRALSPELSDIGFHPPHDGKTLYLGLTDVAAQSIRAGEYTAWDCLHDAYGLTSMSIRDRFGDASALIELHGIFDLPLVAELYAQLPGVKVASPDGSFDSYGSTLCAARGGDRYEYVVDAVSGDPLEGGSRVAHLFASSTPGAVTSLGVWSSESGEPAPEWFGRICR